MPASVYPPRPLKEAMKVAVAIAIGSSGRPLRRLRLAEQLKEAPDGTRLRELLTASRGYGLTEGSRKAKNIELTDLGARFVAGDAEAVREALLSVGLMSKFYAEYEDKIVPAEGVLKDYLREDCGVPDKQVDRAYAGVLQDARDWGLVQESAGSERVVPWEMASGRCAAQLRAVGEGAPASVGTPPLEATQKQPGAAPHVRIEPGLQLNIAIHIAADTPAETIETIFNNMKKYLLPNE